MAYCSNCGQQRGGGERFCCFCGASLDVQPPQARLRNAAAPPTPTRISIVEAKRGGRMGVIGFFIAVILNGVFSIASGSSRIGSAAGSALAFGVGAAYIIVNLRNWNRERQIVRGAAVGWTIAVVLLIGCLGGLIALGSGGPVRATAVAESRSAALVSSPPSEGWSNESASAIDPKQVLIREVKLKHTWWKGGFDDIMMANFTIKNPTLYRFKDFEIKCTHSAPSGTVIDSNTKTIYKVVAPRSTLVLREENMGFIHSQVASSGCQITDLVVVP